jgi:CBS domain-containing protein
MDYQNNATADPSVIIVTDVIAAEPEVTLSEALALLRDSGVRALPIMDPRTGQLIGQLVRPEDPRSYGSYPPPPPRLGGMATPLGVYLTDGVSSGGAGPLGLALSGALLLTIGLVAQAVTSRLLVGVDHVYAAALHRIPGMSGALAPLDLWVSQLVSVAPVLIVLACLRLLPLSGTHAAEHQVVHCVEQGAPLTPDFVRSMPRVHPRCGTNLLAGFFLFLTLFVGVFRTCVLEGMGQADGATLGAVIAAPAALIYWRRLGGFFQYWLATKPASEKQILSAIRAAQEVLTRRREPHRDMPAPLRFLYRIWKMGLVWVSAGYFVALLIVQKIAHLLPAFGRFLEL